MAPKANDINARLARIYFDKVTVNLDRTSAISPEEVWKTMQIIAVNNKAFMNKKLK